MLSVKCIVHIKGNVVTDLDLKAPINDTTLFTVEKVSDNGTWNTSIEEIFTKMCTSVNVCKKHTLEAISLICILFHLFLLCRCYTFYLHALYRRSWNNCFLSQIRYQITEIIQSATFKPRSNTQPYILHWMYFRHDKIFLTAVGPSNNKFFYSKCSYFWMCSIEKAFAQLIHQRFHQGSLPIGFNISIKRDVKSV